MFLCNRFLGASVYQSLFDVPYLRFSKFFSAHFAKPMASSGNHVSSVVSFCAHNKVLWIAARGVVTGVSNNLSIRNAHAMMNFPCNNMSVSQSFSPRAAPNLPVTKWMPPPLPLPAIVISKYGNFGHQSFGKWYDSSHDNRVAQTYRKSNG